MGWSRGQGRTHAHHHHAVRASREPVPTGHSSLRDPPSSGVAPWMPPAHSSAARPALLVLPRPYYGQAARVGSMTQWVASAHMVRSMSIAPGGAQPAIPLATARAAAIPAAVSIVHAMGYSAVGSGSTFLLTRGLSDHTTEGVLAPRVFLDMGITTMVDLADSFATDGEVRATTRSAAQNAQDLAVQAWTQCRRRAPYLPRS